MNVVYANKSKTTINLTILVDDKEVTKNVPVDLGNPDYREIKAWQDEDEDNNLIGDFVPLPEDSI